METVRERTQRFEELMLSPYAAFSNRTKGRCKSEPDCPLRTPYQRDRDRIIHCNAFRRLKHKTQVFLSPEGDHYRTRLTHTLEVAQIARTMAVALQLNETLTEAIALGHDLGHTPFGHAGERVLHQLSPTGFCHFEQSVRVVEVLEKEGQGLNLTFEVRDGILHHTKTPDAATLEGQLVLYADRIAYINHDIEDAVRAGVLQESDIPKEISDTLGSTKSERITTLIHSIVNHSQAGVITMEESVRQSFQALHSFMFEQVYRNPVAKTEESKVPLLIETLYHHFQKYTEQLPPLMQRIAAEEGVNRAVTDYIAGMTDHFAVDTFEALFIPKFWKV